MSLESIIQRRKEGNVLFNDTLNTFYLCLNGVRHMVKDHSDSERGNLLPPHGYYTKKTSSWIFSIISCSLMSKCNGCVS